MIHTVSISALFLSFVTLCITFSICLIPHLSWLTVGLFLTLWHCPALILRFELLCWWFVWQWFCPQRWNHKTKTYSLCKVSVATGNTDKKKLGAFKVLVTSQWCISGASFCISYTQEAKWLNWNFMDFIMIFFTLPSVEDLTKCRHIHTNLTFIPFLTVLCDRF